tara:strand:+ start:1351 stop:1629 length:279 start_codon:yes stop_codon:yes gene_type:complete
MTFKNKYNKKYNQALNKSNSLDDISKQTKIKKPILQKVYNRGIGAFKTQREKVRPSVKSKEQWAMGRLYGFVMKNPKQIAKGQPDRDLYNLI